MAERNSGDVPTIAVYERTASELSIHHAGQALRGLFGDDLGSKEWRLSNDDPLRVTRYNWDVNDVFIISHRHNQLHNGSKPLMDNNPRVETSYAIEINNSGSRMACFDDDLIEEERVEEEIYVLFDQKDALSQEDFDSRLTALAEQRKQVTVDKDRLMISTLQTRDEFAASPHQIRDLNNLLRYLNN